MNKSILSYFLDGVAVAVTSFLLAYAVSSFYIGKRFPSAVLGVSIAVIFTSTFALLSRKKIKNFSLKKSERKEFDDFLSALRFSKTEDILPLLQSATEGEIYLKFGFERVRADEVLFAYQSLGEITFCAVEFTEEALAVAESLNGKVKLLSAEELFGVLKEKNALPKPENAKKPAKKGIKAFLKESFSKKRAGKFALYGGALLLTSRFAFYPIWYIASGSALLIYALAIKFFALK